MSNKKDSSITITRFLERIAKSLEEIKEELITISNSIENIEDAFQEKKRIK